MRYETQTAQDSPVRTENLLARLEIDSVTGETVAKDTVDDFLKFARDHNAPNSRYPFGKETDDPYANRECSERPDVWFSGITDDATKLVLVRSNHDRDPAKRFHVLVWDLEAGTRYGMTPYEEPQTQGFAPDTKDLIMFLQGDSLPPVLDSNHPDKYVPSEPHTIIHINYDFDEHYAEISFRDQNNMVGDSPNDAMYSGYYNGIVTTRFTLANTTALANKLDALDKQRAEGEARKAEEEAAREAEEGSEKEDSHSTRSELINA